MDFYMLNVLVKIHLDNFIKNKNYSKLGNPIDDGHNYIKQVINSDELKKSEKDYTI